MFAEVRKLYTFSFQVSQLRDENDFVDHFQTYTYGNVVNNIDAYLHENFLTSKLDNLHRMLLTLARDGNKAYLSWKLCFPVHPRIDKFQNKELDTKLTLFEDELLQLQLKILIFLKGNFEPVSERIQNILLPFYSEVSLSKKFINFNNDFKILKYRKYLANLEKTLVLRVLYYSSLGRVSLSQNPSESTSLLDQSNLARDIHFLNNLLLDKLTNLMGSHTLNYYILLSSLNNAFEVEAHEAPYLAFELEKKYTEQYSKNIITFAEDKIDRIFEVLSLYFLEGEQDSLRKLINGKTNKLQNKIVFQQKAKTLIYFFKNLYQDGFLQTTSKQKLGRWIEDNFCCLVTDQPRDIKMNTIEKYLKPDDKAPLHIISID